MRKLSLAVSAALFLTSGAIAGPAPKDEPGKAKNQSAGQKAFDELKAEYDKEYNDARKAKTPGPKPDDYASKFKAIATKHAKDPAAASAWAWIAQNRCSADLQEEALAALLAKHLASPAIGGVCQSLVYSSLPSAQSFLESVMAKSQDHDAQGRATYALSQFLDRRNQGAGSKASAADLKKVEDLLDSVVAKFADIGNGALANQAKGDLFEIRNLGIGKTAPEIVGADENGKPMKLSDFRGKVVMLDFWGFW